VDAAARRNYVLDLTQKLGALGAGRDDLILTGQSDLEPYSAYFLGTRLVLDSVGYAVDAPGLDRLRAAIDAHRAHRIFALEPELTEPQGRWSADEVARFYGDARAHAQVVGHYRAQGRERAILQLR
jgi:hypothetical protein